MKLAKKLKMKSKNFITKEKVEKLNSQINKLITDEQYIYGDKQKEIMLLPIIKEQLKNHYLNNPYVRTWLNKLSLELDNIKDIKSLSEIPLLPSKMFKIFDLNTSKEPLQRILYSSSTTGQTPSKIPLDKITSQRQTNALLSILKNFFSKQRRPLLIIDSSNQNKGDKGITARGAAIRGFNILSKETVYACDQVEGELIINKKRLVDFFMKHRDSEIFIMGFTYIIWSKLVEFLKLENLKINCKNVTLIHGGGWKKLEKIKVTKEVFSKELAKLLRTEQKNILDYYKIYLYNDNSNFLLKTIISKFFKRHFLIFFL